MRVAAKILAVVVCLMSPLVARALASAVAPVAEAEPPPPKPPSPTSANGAEEEDEEPKPRLQRHNTQEFLSFPGMQFHVSDTCVACWDKAPVMGLQSFGKEFWDNGPRSGCHHVCMCEECALMRQITDPRCPLCREPFSSLEMVTWGIKPVKIEFDLREYDCSADRLRARHFLRMYGSLTREEFRRNRFTVNVAAEKWTSDIEKLHMEMEVLDSRPDEPFFSNNFLGTISSEYQGTIDSEKLVGLIFLHDVALHDLDMYDSGFGTPSSSLMAQNNFKSFMGRLETEFPGVSVDIQAQPMVRMKLSATTTDGETKHFFDQEKGVGFNTWLNPALLASDYPDLAKGQGWSSFRHKCRTKFCIYHSEAEKEEARFWDTIENMNTRYINMAIKRLEDLGLNRERIFLIGYGSGALFAEKMNVLQTEKGMPIGGSIALDPMNGPPSMFAFAHSRIRFGRRLLPQANAYRTSWSVEAHDLLTEEQYQQGLSETSPMIHLRWVRLLPAPFSDNFKDGEPELVKGMKVIVLRPDILVVDRGVLVEKKKDSIIVKFKDKMLVLNREWLESEGRVTYEWDRDVDAHLWQRKLQKRVGINSDLHVFKHHHNPNEFLLHGLGRHLQNPFQFMWLFHDIKSWIQTMLGMHNARAFLSGRRATEFLTADRLSSSAP